MATREQMGSNIEPGVIKRVSDGLRYAITGVSPANWFGPSQPLQPAAQEQAEGRMFDYPVGYNLRIQPRSEEGISFAQLRGLADGYDLLRLIIETRKDQIEAFDWEIVPKDKDIDAKILAAEIKAATAFFERPDREHDWPEWLRLVVEDLLVIDAVCVYPRMDRGGKLYGLELVDGATVKRLLDDGGRTPMAPSPAYQQILKGIPAADYTTEDLTYMMRNQRTWKVYGYSPVEQIIMTVNIALRRQVSQLQFYTEGNIPEAIAQLPKDWPASAVKDFQGWWDSLMEGNTANRRKMKFIPNIEGILFPKAGLIKDEYDEWLARIACFAFSVSPTAFIKQNNRATGEQAAETAKEEGLMPLLKWTSNKVTSLLNGPVGYPQLAFRWKLQSKVDPLTQAKVDEVYAGIKVLTPNEIREDLGREKLSDADREAAWPAPPELPINGAPSAKAPEVKSQPTPAVGAPPNTNTTTEKLHKAERKVTAVGKYVAKKQPALQAAIAKVLKTQGVQVAAALRRLGKSDLIDDLLAEIDMDGIGAAVIDALTPEMLKAFKTAGLRGLAQVSFEASADITKQLDEAALNYAGERGAELVKGIGDTTRDELRNLVSKGVEEGLSPSALADSIEAMGAFGEARAAMIARTELAFAHVQGNVEGWRASGEVSGKQSILGDLHDKEDECDECADAGIVGIDEEFIPGYSLPPYHPNCICDITPVLSQDNAEGAEE